ncbi:methionyl-tRNA formyltransferase [Enterovirga sp.]|uniref:methionyl-tRNA formyltransferase n=1 Tax=Enterovirga sp. TaxID=2026350 RepID=UPI0026129DF5|nr:methionyl-tRNA formyltransferase [Enterovirga sp.]MDB5592550.1 methionyl-tRNA formyltransferase [Enterovirga sp.]
MTLRVVFMGTPAFAVPTLEAIAAAGHDVVAVFTKAPTASGRGLRERPSPVHAAALARSLPVHTPPTLRAPEEVARLQALAPDVAVVVAYGLLLPPTILAVPRHGCLNLHASLLPRWRGAAPIHRAVMAGDRETGIGVMQMEAGLDTGPVALEARLPIGPDTTTGELHDELSRLGARLAVEALERLETGGLPFAAQPAEGVVYASKITNEEARLDWTWPAARIHDHVRGLAPWPGAFFEADLGGGPERVKLLQTERVPGNGAPGTLLDGMAVACGDEAVRPLRLQRAGRGPVDAEAFWRGTRLRPGDALL